ncbi:MAG: exonuclease domain-containing protein [Planctomycetota bacterium]|nr:exonuclease domain-containing protein [Planctomycetota bacterium]
MRFSLQQPLMQIPIAVIDTETTGVSAAYGERVIEVGIVRLEGGVVVREYQQLIDPGRRISAAVTVLTGISQAMVVGQPRFADQLPAMMSMLEGAAILGHNITFDLSFLGSEFGRMGMDLRQSLAESLVLDTVRIARRRFGRGGNSLPVLSRRLGLEPVVAHRALADAQTTAAVFWKLLEPVGGWGLPLSELIEQQGGVLDIDRPVEAGGGGLPLEVQEALDSGRPVMMEYLDGRGARTQRVVQPLYLRRNGEELLLVAHCQLRNDRRTFKVERIVRLTRIEAPPVAAGQ